MKRKFGIIGGTFSVAACVLASVQTVKAAAVTEVVDPTTIADAYVNVFDPTGTIYQYGFVNSLAANPASFAGTTLTLSPNSSVTDGGTAAATVKVEASTYAENPGLGGDTVTFDFTVTANTLAAGYSVQGFAADFVPNFSSSVQSTSVITTPGDYSVSQSIAPGDIAQWGFVLLGPNATDTTAPLLGSVTIVPTGTVSTPEPASLGLLGLAGAALIRRRRTV